MEGQASSLKFPDENFPRRLYGVDSQSGVEEKRTRKMRHEMKGRGSRGML